MKNAFFGAFPGVQAAQILLCLVLFPQVDYAAAFIPSKEALSHSLNGLGSIVADTAHLHCLNAPTRNRLEQLSDGIHGSQVSLNKISSDYVKKMGQKMTGNGKCDGGFLSVGKEIQLRVDLTVEAQSQVFNEAGSLMGAAQQMVFDQESGSIPTEDIECIQALDDGLSAIDVQVPQVISGYQITFSALEETRGSLQAYREKNLGLAESCGSSPSIESGLISSLVGAASSRRTTPASEFLRKSFLNPESTVTGKIENAVLPTDQQGATIEGEGEKSSYSGNPRLETSMKVQQFLDSNNSKQTAGRQPAAPFSGSGLLEKDSPNLSLPGAENDRQLSPGGQIVPGRNLNFEQSTGYGKRQEKGLRGEDEDIDAFRGRLLAGSEGAGKNSDLTDDAKKEALKEFLPKTQIPFVVNYSDNSTAMRQRIDYADRNDSAIQIEQAERDSLFWRVHRAVRGRESGFQ